MIILLFYLSIVYTNYYLFALSILFLILILPTIYFYIDLCYFAYPYLYEYQGKYKKIREDGCIFLDKHFEVTIHGKQIYKHPVIFCVNHPAKGSSMLSFISLMKIKTKIKIVKFVTNDLTNKIFANLEHIFVDEKEEGQLDYLIKESQKAINESYSILIYPEGKNSRFKKGSRLAPFKSGAFVLAKKLSIPIVPIVINEDSIHEGILANQKIDIHYLDLIDPYDYDIEELKNKVFSKMKKVIR